LLHIFDPGGLAALLQVIMIDIVLAGDNAVVIAMAASRVPQTLRGRVIFWGLVAAVILRLLLALITVSLFKIIGLMLAGGILLLWVCWRLYRDIRHGAEQRCAVDAACAQIGEKIGDTLGKSESRSLVRRAALQIVLADLSMSLDNVLGVAGAAMKHVDVLAIGLLLSIGLMGVAANYLARLLQRHAWISYLGLVIVLYVAVSMIWRGSNIVLHAL
jgi:YjbE family integral membrane protein